MTLEITGRLRPYQEDFVRWYDERRGAILGDDPGVGKTAQAAFALKGFERVLITGPLLSRSVWTDPNGDVYKFAGKRVLSVVGTKPGPLPDGWIFIHYEILHYWLGHLLLWRPQGLIADEAHCLRNRKTKASNALMALSRLASIKKRLPLSGTPIVNSVMDLWPLLQIARPGEFGSHFDFGLEYGGGFKGDFGWSYPGSSNQAVLDELREKLGDVFVRRTRREVLKDLPPVTEVKVLTTLGNLASEYQRAWKDVLEYLGESPLDSARTAEAIRSLTELLKITSSAKIPATTETASDLVRAYGKVVIFTWFRQSATLIGQKLGMIGGPKRPSDIRAIVTHGGESQSERLRKVASFVEEKGPTVFIGTYGSVGSSINDLCVAHVGVFHDLSWVPKDIIQAKGRLDRSGQKNPVSFYSILAEESIDIDISERVLSKVDKGNDIGISTDDLEILRSQRRESVLNNLVLELKERIS